RYRVRATQPYKPRPVELLSAVKTITVKPPEIPTPPTPKPHTSKPHTSDPNYNRVHEMSAEAMSMARQMHLLSTRIPPTYGSLRTSIISWSDRTHTAALSARRDSESVVVNGTSPTPDLHQRILEASTQGERYAEQAEDDAGDLKRQADKRNDDRTEDLARALRELADDAGDKLRDCKKLFD
ncbi:MAG: hypothetical protein HQ581_05850, partial [Planctomycetes bacterium]|nr:hypothetical protein [Planctomycetota bacterium]